MSGVGLTLTTLVHLEEAFGLSWVAPTDANRLVSQARLGGKEAGG